MTKMKKLMSVVLAAVMTMSLVMPVSAANVDNAFAVNTGIDANYTVESINKPEELEIVPLSEALTNPKILNVICEANDYNVVSEIYDDAIETAKEELVADINANLAGTGLPAVTWKDIEEINQEFNGMSESAIEYLHNEVANEYMVGLTQPLDVSGANETTISPRGVEWVIRFTSDDEGFYGDVKYTSGQTATVDYVSADITRNGLSSSTWSVVGTPRYIDKANATGRFYTWVTPVSYIEERFDISNQSVTDGGSVLNFANTSIYRDNFTAGSYGSITASGGHRHHFVSQSALSTYGYNTNAAYCIRMSIPDHIKTGSYGSSSYVAVEKQYMADGDYVGLLNYELADLGSKTDHTGKQTLRNKYYSEIATCLVYYKNLFSIIEF